MQADALKLDRESGVASGERRVRRAGIVAALPGEARPLARLRAQGRAQLPNGAWVALSGMGPARAAATARALVAEGVDGLISWGSAAALVPVLAPGDLLLPRQVIAASGSIFDTDEAWRGGLVVKLAERVRIREGALAESPELLVDTAGKQRLQAASSAAAADMESAAIAAVAAEFGLPFIAIRAIVDDATMSVPLAARAAVDGDGALRPQRMLRALLRRPSTLHAQLRSLKQLSVAFRAAQISLGRTADCLLNEPPT